MRFFSNDSKESSDDRPDVDVQDRAEDVNPDQAHDDHPERVQSDPVAVPQQRAGSPWSSAPDNSDNADDELADQERQDGTVDTEANGHEDEGPAFHEPGAQPTAFGASTVGGAVAASATANPQNDSWDATDRDSAADSGVGDDRSVAPGDGVVTDADDRLRPDDSEVRHDGDTLVPSTESSAAAATDDTTDDTADSAHRADDVDLPLDDRDDSAVSRDDSDRDDSDRDDSDRDDEHRMEDTTPPDTSLTGTTATTYGPDGTVTTSSDTDTDTTDDSAVDSDTALKDEGGFDDPQAVDPSTDKPLTTSDSSDSSADTDRSDSTDSTAAAAAVPVAAGAGAAAGVASARSSDDSDADKRPGSVTEPDLGSLFGSDDAQAFRDRWRDVQLRFVDSPKEATTDAARMVDEAVDKLTASLKAQKDQLSNDSDDTERLRVELRGYRVILNRILDL